MAARSEIEPSTLRRSASLRAGDMTLDLQARTEAAELRAVELLEREAESALKVLLRMRVPAPAVTADGSVCRLLLGPHNFLPYSILKS